MYESFPSLALQMYLLLLNDNVSKSTVTASMLAICINASLSMWIYLISRSNKHDIYHSKSITTTTLAVNIPQHVPSQEVDPATPNQIVSESNIANGSDGNITTNIKTFDAIETMNNDHSISDENESNTNKTMQYKDQSKKHWIIDYYSHVFQHKISFIFIYIYMITDFYLRTFPIIAIIAWYTNVSDEYNLNTQQILVAVLYYFVMSIYSYYMCYDMRKSSKNIFKSHQFIMKIFFVLLFSSFYNLLCSFDFLEKDPYFGMSVQFSKHLKEHYIRVFISVLTYIILNIIIHYYDTKIRDYVPFFVLYITFFILNIISVFFIKKYVYIRNRKRMLKKQINP